MKKPSIEQRKQWLREKRCHVCGKNRLHNHPIWMWLANRAPDVQDNPEAQKEAEKQRKIRRLLATPILGGEATEEHL